MARGLPGVGQIVPDDMQREGLWAQVQKLLGNTFVEKDSIKIIPPMPGASVELLRIDQIHEIVEPAVSRYLSPMGFESHRQLVWVRSADAPIRQVFKLELLKGAGLDFAWGLSLDFVPHVSGSRVKWHRTPKTAMLDLGVRPGGAARAVSRTCGVPRLCVRGSNPRLKKSVSTLKNSGRRLQCWPISLLFLAPFGTTTA